MIHIDVDAAVTVPVNIMPLMDDTDFITRETGIAYNQAGMDLVWNFITSAGVITQTAVTPTTSGDYDWTHVGDGMYKIEIPASGGASINNDTEGTGYFTGICTGVLAWRSPDIIFRAAALNDALIDGGDVLDVSVTELGGVAQSATDLKDFADAGYDPATNKVQGVVLVDTTTTNTDMVAAAPTAVAIRSEIDSNSIQLAAIVADTNELQTDDIPGLIAALNDFDPASDTVANVTLVATTTTNTDMRGTDSAATAAALATAQADLDIITGADGVNLLSSTQASVDAIEADTNELQTDDVPGLIAALNDITAADVWTASGRALSDPAGFKKNTAVNNFTFLMIDSTDHVTPITGETVTAERSIDGAAFGACTNSVSEISDGMYKIDFSAADMNGDIVAFKFTATNSDPRYITIATET